MGAAGFCSGIARIASFLFLFSDRSLDMLFGMAHIQSTGCFPKKNCPPAVLVQGGCHWRRI